MERSPRSAAVLRSEASMGHTLRSIVISLAIAITITKSPASGFTIPRAQDILTKTQDLETAESKQLNVTYGSKTLDDNNTIISTTIGEAGATVLDINDPDISNKNVNPIQFVTIEADLPTRTTQHVSSTLQLDVTNDSTNIISTETTYHTLTTSIPSGSQTTTKENQDDSKIELTDVHSLPIESTANTFRNYSNDTTKISIENITPTEKPDTSITNSVSNTDESVYTSSDISNMTGKTVSSMDDSQNETQNTTGLADQTNITEESAVSKTNSSPDARTTISSESKSTDVTTIVSEVPTTEVTKENFTTESVTVSVSTEIYSALPHWKKYTTIDRKRTSTEDTTASENDMAQAETAQTRINLEKVFTNAPIPSLQKLRDDLINSQESTTTRNFDTTTNSAKAEVYIADGSESVKSEIISKRAGYIDNLETTTANTEEATTSEAPPAKSTDMTGSTFESVTTEVEVADNKNKTVYESQSQLAEDAIKEELLKEEMLNDNEENAKRYHDVLMPPITDLKTEKNIDEPVTVRELVTEDMLSVRPIGLEKKKNTILYAVSPNYKPLKKIDIQPPKQFVRDPDDNSWRNESISSLGIVFKPKNASKSFTQVLKNKTEIELGNMTEKDNKGDVPDLRVRLEKIAEVRKSKKRINKFGDTVYSDYEESSESGNIFKEETTSPMSPSEESILNFTPPPPTQSSTTEFDLKVNAISTEKFDIFKYDVTTPLTTIKPTKLYNMPEYYDATDEYDHDYVNQHRIDLKKFTKKSKAKENFATRPPELLYTQPMREYQPERKATIQYFPPTQKVTQKVNINDYDANFNRKVNMYTVNKDTTESTEYPSFGTPSPTFGTASPSIKTESSSQTESYERVNKATMKPTFTALYQHDNLDKNLYLTTRPQVLTESPDRYVPNNENFHRGSYVIKHYRDFIIEAAKESEDERSEYLYTESPVRGVTMNELPKMNSPSDSNQGEEQYDYDVKSKDILNGFVDNFNQNSERFKVDFPILYNSSVLHRQSPESGQVASSTAFMKRLYEVRKPTNFVSNRRTCDPPCDMTVDLSPAYELHYYVPDQEEKEEMEQTPAIPYRYR